MWEEICMKWGKTFPYPIIKGSKYKLIDIIEESGK